MPTPPYMSIEGTTQGNITAGCFTEDSVGNISVKGNENEVLVEGLQAQHHHSAGSAKRPGALHPPRRALDDLVGRLISSVMLRAPQRNQDKACFAENGRPFSRSATRYGFLCGAPCGPVHKPTWLRCAHLNWLQHAMPRRLVDWLSVTELIKRPTSTRDRRSDTDP